MTPAGPRHGTPRHSFFSWAVDIDSPPVGLQTYFIYSLWQAMLYGVGPQDQKIIRDAKKPPNTDHNLQAAARALRVRSPRSRLGKPLGPKAPPLAT